MIVDNVVDLIGKTPMVRIHGLNPNPDVECYVKLEKFNPGGSVKDRIARFMIEYAEKTGELTKDKIVIEPTSGNTGIGLALVCLAKGYRLVLVMPDTMTMERRKIMMAHGAQIVLSPGDQGMDGAEDLAREIIDEEPSRYFMPNQFANQYNSLAHYKTTGKEIWHDTQGKITHFVGGLGTSGTLMGVSRRLKENNPDVRVIAVEPEPEAAIQGLKNLEVQYVPDIFEASRIDERHHVSLREAEEMARRLTLSEGLFCGPSSGGIFHIARQKLEEIESGVMVVMLPDGGERYLSTELCDVGLCVACARRWGIPCAFLDEDLVPQRFSTAARLPQEEPP